MITTSTSNTFFGWIAFLIVALCVLSGILYQIVGAHAFFTGLCLVVSIVGLIGAGVLLFLLIQISKP